jgi:putative tricarboxylic transport membrane protein
MPGGAGSIAEDHLQKQPADGYMILCVSGDLPINLLVGRTKYKLEDFVHVARVQQDIGTIMIRVGDERFTNLDEFIAYAQKTPVTIGGTGAAGLDEIAVAEFAKATGIQYRYVTYEAAGVMQAALLGGDIHAMHEEPGPAIGLIEAQKVKPIMILAERRIEGFEDVPAAGEWGFVPGGRIRGFLVRRGTPDHIVRELESAIKKAYESPEYQAWARERLLHLVPGWGGSAEYTEQTRQLIETYEEILTALGYIN